LIKINAQAERRRYFRLYMTVYSGVNWNIIGVMNSSYTVTVDVSDRCLSVYEGHLSSSLCANQHRFLERRLFLPISIRRCANGWPASVSPSSSSSSSLPSPFLASSHHTRRPAGQPSCRAARRPAGLHGQALPGSAPRQVK